MRPSELRAKVNELRRLARETEWVEFKHNKADPQEVGEYMSALSNGAALHGRSTGYIVWGFHDVSHAVVGTTFRPRKAKKGNEELEGWLSRLLQPRIDFTIHEFEYDGLPVVMFAVQAAQSHPTRFGGDEFIRVGSSKRKTQRLSGEKRASLGHPIEKPRRLVGTRGRGCDAGRPRRMSNALRTTSVSREAPAAERLVNLGRQNIPKQGESVYRWEDHPRLPAPAR